MPPNVVKKEKSMVMKDATDSMEMTGIVLPAGNGVVAIGDLWNCRTNTYEGNCFDGTLPPNFMQADPIQTLEYSYHSCNKSEDVVDIMKVSAELALDITTGGFALNATGKGSYENTDKSNFRDDNIVVSYEAVTYQVRALPSADSQVSPRILQMLQDEKIVATHFVQAVLVGGISTGSMTYREKVSDSKKKITGALTIDMAIGPVTINAKAKFYKLDTELKEDYETTVQVEAQPRFDKSPRTVEQMFKQVESLDAFIDRERHFPDLDKRDPNGSEGYVMRVTGVPIRFKLVPISHIMPIQIDEKYRLLDPETLEDYLQMNCSLRDFTNPEYFKRLLQNRAPTIIPILMDDLNPLTAEVRAFAVERAGVALGMKHESAKIFTAYKTDEQKVSEIRDLLERYQTQFAEIDLEQKYIEFIRRGKQELADIRASDVNGLVDDEGQPTINFFSNRTDMEDWYNSERTIKILFRTDQKAEGAPSGVFLRLFNLSPALKKAGIEVGVAFPNISDGRFTLTFKTYDSLHEYSRPEIRYFLRVLSVAVDEGETITKLFYSLNAALSGLNLPMLDYLYDVPNLAIVMSEYKDTVICETYCDLLARLFETVGSYNLVFPIEGLNSSVEMMRFYRQLRVYLPERYPNLKHKFFVSRFNNVNTKYNAPLCLLFFENRFQAVCLDHLDVLIMVEELGREEPDFSLLSYGRIRESCLYPPRADWAISVIQNLSLEHETFKTDPVFDLIEFPNNPDPRLKEAVEFTRASSLRDEPTVLTTVALLSLTSTEVPEELEAILSSYGWKDGGFSSEIWKDIEWADFYQDVRDFLSSQAPFLMKVVLALEELKSLEPGAEDNWTDEDWNKKIDVIISFILQDAKARGFSKIYSWRGLVINEDDIFENLRKEVISYDRMPGKVRKIGISKLFENFIAKESARDELFHLFVLSHLLEGMQAEGTKSFKQLLMPLCKKYCERLTILENEYPRGNRRLQDYITERQLFKILGVLGEVSFSPHLYVLHQELFNFSTLPAPISVKSLIEKVSRNMPETEKELEFNIEQCEVLWTNPKFIRALRQVFENEGVLDSLIIHVWRLNEMTETFMKNKKFEENNNLINVEDEYSDFDAADDLEEKVVGELDEMPNFPWFIPPDISERIKALIVLRTRPNFDYPRNWGSVITMIEAFQIIEAKSFLPFDFQRVLRDNMESNGAVLKPRLLEVGALTYWVDEDFIFSLPWSWEHVSRYLKQLMEPAEQRRNKLSIKDKTKIYPKLEKSKQPIRNPSEIRVNVLWEKFVKDGILQTLSYETFCLLDAPQFPPPLVLYDKLNTSVPAILRHIFQRLLMGDSSSLWSPRVESYIHYPPLGPRPGQIDFGDGLGNQTGLGYFLSRADIMTALLHLTDPIATYHILRLLAGRVKVPLPLIVTSIKQAAVPKETVPTEALFFINILKDICIPELENLTKEPRLFRTPYRFVLTLRVGEVTGQDEKGRSTLINSHLMSTPQFFASRGDSGSQNGRPLNRIGFLEFSPMTPSTCETGFWQNFVEKLATSGIGQDEVNMILLGILHGDALQVPSLFEVILPYVSTIVIFWRVNNYTELRTKRSQLIKLLGTKRRILDVALYPDSTIADKVHDRNLIFKELADSPQHIVNRNKLHNLVSEAMLFSNVVEGDLETTHEPVGGTESKMSSLLSNFTSAAPKGAKPLSTSMPIKTIEIEPVSTPESEAILTFIQQHTIGDIQDGVAGHTEHQALLPLLSQKFATLLNSVGRDRALTHLTWELDRLSRRNGAPFYERVLKLRAQIKERLIQQDEAVKDIAWIKETQEEGRISMSLLRRNTLNVHDLWRITWTNGGPASLTGDHLKAGFPMEMFHPTYSSSLWGHGVEEIINGGNIIDPGTKIFVVSAFGLKGSGKSTLLNALFGPGFTTHGTTLGFQVRLCWLNPTLKESLDCDAFLVIDSEGLGAMENRIDEIADAQERALLAFLISISGVSLATIKGRRMEELTDILDLSMFSLSKLREREGFLPADVLLVQNFLPQQPDDNVVSSEFATCLSNAVQSSRKFLLPSGLRMTEAHRLKQVKSRNKHAEVLFKVKPFVEEEEYSSSIQQLHSRIIQIAQVSRGVRTTFGEWFKLTKELWEEIQESKNGILRSTNSAALSKTISLEERIIGVKKAIDAAYFHHEKILLGKNQPLIDEKFRNYHTLLNFDKELDIILTNLLRGLNTVISACAIEEDNPIRARKRKIRSLAAGGVNHNACPACTEAFPLREALFAELEALPKGFLQIEGITRYETWVKDAIYERVRQSIVARQLWERKSDGDLFERLEEIKNAHPTDENEQFKKFLQQISTMQYILPSTYNCYSDLTNVYYAVPHVLAEISLEPESHLDEPLLAEDIITFDVSIYNSALESAMNLRKPDRMTWLQHDWLVVRLAELPKKMWDDFEAVIYRHGMVANLRERVEVVLNLFQEYCGGDALLPDFRWAVHLFAIRLWMKYIAEKQEQWDVVVVTEDDGTLRVEKGGNPLKVFRNMEAVFKVEKDFFIPKNS